jgi:hypothetical protein
MGLDHVLPSAGSHSVLEWAIASFEQSLEEFHIILLDEHFRVALEMLEVSVCR